MTTEHDIAAHYAHGALAPVILEALAAAGKDLGRLTIEDLAPVDEFHTGGRQATIELASRLAIGADQHLLDVGSGFGGTARHLAATYECRVTGIDLMPEYVDVANLLAGRVGLADRVAYVQGSATALPFAAGRFDGATMLHVGMNIADKDALFAEVHRVLKPGAFFAVFDMMRIADGPLAYPVPWAATDKTSFVADAATYHDLLGKHGFALVSERNRRDFAIAFFGKIMARIDAGAMPPLGLHIVMGRDFAPKIVNIAGNIERGLVAPIEMICRR